MCVRSDQCVWGGGGVASVCVWGAKKLAYFLRGGGGGLCVCVCVVVVHNEFSASLAVSCTCADVPGDINHSMVTGEVEDLLRVRLTWPIPEDNNSPIDMYTISHCEVQEPGSDLCFSNLMSVTVSLSDLAVVTDVSVTYVLVVRVDLFNEDLLVNVTATNAVGEGGAENNPALVRTATTRE